MEQEKRTDIKSWSAATSVIKFVIGILVFSFTIGYYLNGIESKIDKVTAQNTEMNKVVNGHFIRLTKKIDKISNWINKADIRFLQIENQIQTNQLKFNNKIKELETKTRSK